MKQTTAGEKLFFLIRDRVLVEPASLGVAWARVGSAFSQSADSDFADYLRGAAAIHAMRRLLRFWRQERAVTPNEPDYVRKVARFAKDEIFPSLDTAALAVVSRAVVKAEAVSDKQPSPRTRTLVISESVTQRCYLCSRLLNPASALDTADALTLEHLWPASLGGDSIDENLLPACTDCQLDTKDTFAWEWYNVHNFVLGSSPSSGELKSVDGRARFARHYLEATRLGHSKNLSLKEAFVRLGPVKSELSHAWTGTPLTFFDLKTFEANQ